MKNMKKIIALVLALALVCPMLPVVAKTTQKITDSTIPGWIYTNNYGDTNVYIDDSDGNRAAVIQFKGYAEKDVSGQFTQTTPKLLKGHTYCLEFDAKAKNVNALNFQFNWEARKTMTPGTKSYDWVTYKISYTPIQNGTAVLRFIVEDRTDGFWIDNVKFYDIDTPSKNLVTNGDFEKAGGKNWVGLADEDTIEIEETEDWVKKQKTTMFAERMTATIDGNDDEWKDVEPFPVAVQEIFGNCKPTGDVTGGEVKFGFDDENLYFYLEINDTTYFALPDPSFWNNDGIQFATATVGNPGGSRVEKGAVLYHDGSGTYQSSSDYRISMKREGNKSIYEVAYPWSVNFSGIAPKSLLFNVAYNNNIGGVGQGFHDSAYSITPGIVTGGKNAFKYNPLVLWTPFEGVEYGIVSPLTMDYGTTRIHEVNLRNPGKESKTVDITIPELSYKKSVTLKAGEKQQIQIPVTVKKTEDLYINTSLQVGGEKMNQENMVAVEVIRTPENFDEVVAKLQGYADDLSALIYRCQDQGIEVTYERAGHSIIEKFIERTQYEMNNNDYARVFQYEKELKQIYDECKANLEGYLAGTKTERHASKFLTGEIKLDGMSVIANTVTDGVEEEKPVFLIGYCTWQNGPSFMEHFATIGASAIQTKTAIYDFISPVRGGGWSTGGRKENGLAEVVWGTTTEDAYSGTHSLKVVNPQKARHNTYVTLGQRFDAKPNTTYEFGLKAKGSGMTEQAQANGIASAWFNLNGIYSGLRYAINNTKDWTDYNFTYTTKPGEESLEFLFCLQDKIDELYIDDIYVREKGTDKNLIYNSDFEYYPKESEVIPSEKEMIEKYGWYYNYQWVDKLRKTFRLAEQYNVTYDLIVGVNDMPDFMKYHDPAVWEAGRTEHFTDVPLDNQTIIDSLAFFGKLVAALAKESKAPVSMCIANEPKVYASQGHYYIPHWQAFLKERYDNSIDNLNATYGSSYKSFEEVKMPTGPVKTAIYTDYRDFNDGLLLDYHEALIAAIKPENPKLFLHSKMMQYFRDGLWARYYTMGTNPELLMPVEDVNGCDAWSNPGGNRIIDKLAWHDMLTSISDKPVWNTEDHNAGDGNPPSYPAIEPYFSSADLWNCCLRGLGFSAMWWMETDVTVMPWYGASASVASSNAMHKPLRMWESAKVTLDVNRLSKEIAAIQKQERKVGILYSRIATTYHDDYVFMTASAYEDAVYSGQRVGFLADSAPEDMHKYGLVIVPQATNVKKDFVDNLKTYIENGGKVLLVGENCILKDEYNRPHDQATIDYIYAHADTTSTVTEKIEEMGYNDLVLVHAETGERVDNVEWSYTEYEGKIVASITSFDNDNRIPVKLMYKGKEIATFTEMRSMEEIQGSYTLLPLRPIFVTFDI
ncbi:MAG: carbohydrate binding domain-containing protein [Clostridia bacterium]|nr:carbohydrate binding domain-containing protein [Clostridia bacterium]